MKKTYLFTASAIASVMALPSAAMAQVPTTPTDTEVAPTRENTDEPEANADGSQAEGATEILVTGSRIRTRFNQADPVTVLTNTERTEAGFNTSTNLLQSTAVTNGTSQINNAYGGYVTNGGPGANTLSLRGLGTSRTLILLNGRRLAPSGSRGAVGSADLNSLPTAMVDRIEVLNSGASSVYGSDAVAGVINIITRKLNGLELSGQVNVPEAGAGSEYRIAAVFGHTGERFSINGSAEYYNRTAMTFADRDFTRCQTDKRLTGAGAAEDSGSFIDPRTGQPKCYGIAAGTGAGGVTVNTLGTRNFAGNTVALAPGVPAGYTGVCNRFRPNSAITTGALPGYECVGGGTIGLDVRDTFPNSLLDQALISPTENYNGFLSGTYQVDGLGDAEIYAELLVSRRQSRQLGNRQLSIDYNAGSLLVPTNLRNDTFIPYSAASTPTAPRGTNVAARVFANYGNYDNYQTADFVKFGGGIRGKLFGDWRYDAYASKSWSDSRYTSDLVLTSRLAQSLDVVASGNGFACRNPVGGCVAAPALNATTIGGQFPQAWIDYIGSPVTGTTKFRETVYSAVIDGPLFELPAGAVQVAIGVERREQSIDDTPSEESQNNNVYNFTSSTPTRGSDSVNEAFAEIELPVLRDMVVHDLTINASGRYTDYASYGSNWTYKAGASLSPIRGITFRGSYGTSFRAPALFEQFLGSTSGFNAASTDICNNLNANTAPVRLRNCQADGIPLGFQATQSVQVNQRGGAESGLSAETSRNINAGVVVQPKFGFGNLSLAVDYFDVKVDNGISQLTSATIQSQCYDSVEFRANAICSLLTRSTTAPYQLQVTTGYVNISTSALRGIDYTARFTADVGPGSLRLGAQVTQFLERYNQTLPTDPQVELTGLLAFPKFTGVFDGAYTIGDVTLRYGVEWVGKTDSSEYLGADATYDFRAPDYWLHSASVNFRTKKLDFSFGVRNLLDTDPPFISSGGYNRVGNALLYSGYDFSGRTFFAATTARF